MSELPDLPKKSQFSFTHSVSPRTVSPRNASSSQQRAETPGAGDTLPPGAQDAEAQEAGGREIAFSAPSHQSHQFREQLTQALRTPARRRRSRQ